MIERENPIAKTLAYIAMAEIIAAIFLGVILGQQEVAGYYRTRTEMNWTITIGWWIAGFISGMVLLALSEIVEKLHQINEKLKPKDKVEEDDLELIKD